MEFILQNYPCSLCHEDQSELVLKKQGFSIVKCSNCGFVYVNPRVENKQLATIYQHSYFKNKDYGYTGYEQEKRLRVKNFERWVSDAEKFITEKGQIHALDIGCAAGYCLDLMLKKGWISKGIELDEEMCERLKLNGYDVSGSRIEEFETETKFSVITLFDVIEHIPNIDTTFKKLNSLLTRNGIVIMVTPDHNSFQRKLLRKKWFQYKPIEHIQYFDKKSLQIFTERNGLRIVDMKKCGQYADTEFLVNRLKYYHFGILSVFFGKLLNVFRLKNSFFYTDTGSLFIVLKHK